MTRKSFFLALAACAVLLAAAPAWSAEWLTNFDRAVERARTENRPILVNFTGSDWCGWCIRLKNEVFDTPQFNQWAEQNVVLLEVDLPRTTQLPADLRRQNERLRTRMNIQSYPTVVFLSPDGTREIGRSGYVAGGPQRWIASVQAFVQPAGPQLDVYASLVSGMQQARTQDRPLLVIIDPNCDQRAMRLLEDRQFANLAMRRLVVVHLRGTLDEEQTRTVGDLRTRCAAGADPASVMLLDRTQTTMLFSQATIPQPSEMVRSIRHALAMPAQVPAGQWLTNYQQALDLAAELDRPILLYFTGSDWCAWCIRLDEEILATRAFREYAQDNVILVRLDFPRGRQLPAAERQQNERLREQFNVQGFPSVIVLSPDGNRIGQMGYMRGGPDAFLPRLREIVQQWRADRRDDSGRGIRIRIRI